MIRILSILALLIGSANAAVIQSGNVTPGHVAAWATTDVVQDGGPATNGTLTELGTQSTGLAYCQNNAPISGAYTQLCLGMVDGIPSITSNSYNGAPQARMQLIVDGISYALPGGSGSGGAISAAGTGGFWADGTPVPAINRFNDRFLAGNAAVNTGNNPANWTPTPGVSPTLLGGTGMDYFDAANMSGFYSNNGGIGATFASRSSMYSVSQTGAYKVPMGLAFAGIADATDPGVVRGEYGIGYKTSELGQTVYTSELAMANKGNLTNISPLDFPNGGSPSWAAQTAIHWDQCGAEPSQLHGPVNPCSAAIVFLSSDPNVNSLAGTGGTFRNGIVFLANSLYGADGQGGTSGPTGGIGEAIKMAPGHALDWIWSSTGAGGALAGRLVTTATAAGSIINIQNSQTVFSDTSNHPAFVIGTPFNPPAAFNATYSTGVFQFGPISSSAYELYLHASGSGQVTIANNQGAIADFITSGGTNALNVQIKAAQGTGSPSITTPNANLFLGSSGLPTNATTGMIQIPSVGGLPTGTPQNASSGATMIYDSVDAKLCVYTANVGVWKCIVLL